MKKRVFSLLLALCMIIGLLPVTTISAAAASAKYYTVEQYDADGNGTMLVPPTETTNWTGSYGTTFITSLLGSDNVTMKSGAVTGIKGADGEWLNNDGDSKWYIATNYENEVYLDSSWFYASDVTVLRFIYVPNGDFSAAGMDADGDWADAYMWMDKSDLIKTLSAYNGVALGGNRLAAYNAGIETILDINATDDDVAAAITNMETATDSATAVELKTDGEAVESIDLYEGQKQTLTAELTPDGSTDELIWTSSDPDVVSVIDGVIKGMSAGSATVTVEAEAEGVTDSVDVTVTELDSVSITTMTLNAPNVIEAETGSLILKATATPTGIANLDWVWSVEDDTIATVTTTSYSWMAEVRGKAAGTTKVYATLGSKTAEFEVVVIAYEGPYVYFDFDDESKEDLRLDENDTITLTSLDAGYFRVANISGTPVWSCNGYVTIYHPEYGEAKQYHTWINSETGRWTSSGTQPPTASVTVGGSFSKQFTIIDQNLSNLTELKIYVNGTEVSNENPFVMTGTGRANVQVKGLLDGEWITIPQSALECTSSDTTGNIRILGNELILNRGGEATLTIKVLGSDVSASFKARCEYVAVEGIEVIAPETAYMHDYNAYTECFVGLLPNTGFQVKFTPENATNKDYNIEALTPDVAIYWKEHDNGLVPKKPGTAKFKVSSVDNPDVSQEITVNFEYKNKLTAAACEDFTMQVGKKQGLPLSLTPGNASEQRFNWTCEPSGIVGIESKIATDVGGTSHWFNHTISAWSTGTVQVTGTPVDQTGGCEPIQFTVTVTESGELAPEVDYLALAKEDIAHGLDYLSQQSLTEFGDEWTIFTILRAGDTMSQANQASYCASIKEKLTNDADNLETNDYARIVLALGAMGKDPSSFEGFNLIETLYSNANLRKQASNLACWTLIALDSRDYDIPDDALWTREKLVDHLLKFQVADGDNAGSFDLSMGGTTGSVDMTGMILQALAPYYDTEHPAVQEAFAKALEYLESKMTINAGFVEGGSENSCTVAQVINALCAAGMDPLNSSNGLTMGTSNMIGNLHQFRDEDNGGFKLYYEDSATTVDLMSTYQSTYAFEAYRRFAEGENRLYDLTDVPVFVDTRTELTNLVAEAKALKKSNYTSASWAVLETALTAAEETLAKEDATEEELTVSCETLSAAISGLVAQSGGSSGSGSGSDNTIKVTFRLIGAEQATQDVDLSESNYVPKYVTWIKTTSYKMDEGAKVYDVFMEALDKAGLKQSGADNNYVRWITAPDVLGGYQLGEFDNGPYSGWMYTVNGIHVNKGLKEQTLKNGDEIIWHYINDYRYEDSQWATGSEGNKDVWDKWLDAPDVNPSSGSSSGGSSGGGSSSGSSTSQESGSAATGTSDGSTDNGLPFTDISGHWALEAIRYAYKNGLFSGTSDTTFGPNVSMNRAMLVTVLYRMEGKPEITGTNKFADVVSGQWYTDAVTWASENEIVSGYSADKFGPTDTITREQMASILNRYAAFKGYDVSAANELGAFTDANMVSDWALASMKWANAEKLINGRTTETLAPKGSATRAEVAQILMTFAQNVAK